MKPSDAGLTNLRRDAGLGVYIVWVDALGSGWARILDDDSVVVNPPPPDGGRNKRVRLPGLHRYVRAIDTYRKDNDQGALDGFDVEDA